jgi:CDP-diacylglycerol--glycerol-3-phosphate 3-phosphatidyltransferase
VTVTVPMTPTMWTVPNVLTGLRLLLVPFFGAVLLTDGDSPGGQWTALALFGGASITDAADGWLARRLGQCTDFGALVDPIADKALIATALVCLSHLDVVPWWATAVILAREVAVTVLRLTVLRHGVIPASRGGKIKTVLQTLALGLAIMPLPAAVTPAVAVLVIAAVVVTVVTGLDYVLRALRLRAQARSL